MDKTAFLYIKSNLYCKYEGLVLKLNYEGKIMRTSWTRDDIVYFNAQKYA